MTRKQKTIPIPVGSNFSNELLTNVGTIRNNGVEFSINAQPIKKNNMLWDLGFNITYNNNEITNLTKVEDPNYKGVLTGGISGGTGNQMQIHSVGYNTFSFFGFKQVYNQDGSPVEGLYEDLNKDGIINDNDRYRYKSSQPRVFLGFSTNFDWNKWNAGFVLRANIDNYVYNNVNSQYGVYRAILFNQNYLANAVTDVFNSNFENNRYLSDYYVENASFLRMDNLYVGYNLGQLWKNSNLRINFNVQNVFTITKYSGLDPEIPGGIDNNFYPRPRTFTLGFGLDF
jgi:TonB-dependent starch-binding outer membrane protein SusC